MQSAAKTRMRLQRMLDDVALVRIDLTPAFSDREWGFVVAIGEKWLLVSRVTDGAYFDGYVAMRLRDITQVSRDRSFSSRALTALGTGEPRTPDRAIDLNSTRGLLESVGARDAIFGIEKERERRAMWIGIIDEIHEGTLWLRELDTKAKWSKRPRGYGLAKITSVVWGDRYMAALAICASAPPAPAPRLAASTDNL